MSNWWCEHADTSIVRLIYANGAVHVRELCDACGSPILVIKKSDVADILDELPIVNNAEVHRLREQFWKAFWAENERTYLLRRQAEREEWIEQYNEYLQSPEWRAMRSKILRRDNWMCQRCHQAKAEVVHHLSYANVFKEQAADLMSLCHRCHSRIHNDKPATAPVPTRLLRTLLAKAS